MDCHVRDGRQNDVPGGRHRSCDCMAAAWAENMSLCGLVPGVAAQMMRVSDR